MASPLQKDLIEIARQHWVDQYHGRKKREVAMALNNMRELNNYFDREYPRRAEALITARKLPDDSCVDFDLAAQLDMLRDDPRVLDVSVANSVNNGLHIKVNLVELSAFIEDDQTTRYFGHLVLWLFPNSCAVHVYRRYRMKEFQEFSHCWQTTSPHVHARQTGGPICLGDHADSMMTAHQHFKLAMMFELAMDVLEHPYAPDSLTRHYLFPILIDGKITPAKMICYQCHQDRGSFDTYVTCRVCHPQAQDSRGQYPDFQHMEPKLDMVIEPARLCASFMCRAEMCMEMHRRLWVEQRRLEEASKRTQEARKQKLIAQIQQATTTVVDLHVPTDEPEDV